MIKINDINRPCCVKTDFAQKFLPHRIAAFFSNEMPVKKDRGCLWHSQKRQLP